MMLKKSPLFIAMMLPLLSACQALQEPQAASNTQAELEKMQQVARAPKPLQVPAAVNDDLLSPLPPLRADLQLPRFNVSALNVELSEFFS
ncbi:MAG: pilus (MSHA type) biogenesis protein MshL, partial [Gammaproteobacteria bacterium]|nr:pilus (MSHA type) biogenesis protein MshL [Gammaproteobacteria bacterium]